MDVNKAKTLAKQMIKEFGLSYKLKIDNAKCRFGFCSYYNHTISLSKHLIELNEEKEVIDTILHEIAHALVGPGHHHDRKWKQKAIEIGCSGKRSVKVNMPTSKKYLFCSNCKEEIPVYRLTKIKKACRSCCDKYNGGKFSEYYILEVKNNEV